MYFSLYSKAVCLAFVLVGFPHLPLNHNNNKKNIQRSKSSECTRFSSRQCAKRKKILCSFWL